MYPYPLRNKEFINRETSSLNLINHHERLDDPFSPKQNITAGTKYLKQQLDSFGDIRLGLAAYNAGAGRVTSQGMIDNIPETQAYVARVMGYYRHYQDHQ